VRIMEKLRIKHNDFFSMFQIWCKESVVAVFLFIPQISRGVEGILFTTMFRMLVVLGFDLRLPIVSSTQHMILSILMI